MKRAYGTPVAREEEFLANNYVASCNWHITSESGNNKMMCANINHDHCMDGTYFTSVWVEATNSTCQIIVDKSGIGKTEVVGGSTWLPARGATVYGKNGEKYSCNKTIRKNGQTYYVPFTNKNSPCYGSYVNEGSYSEIMEKVLS